MQTFSQYYTSFSAAVRWRNLNHFDAVTNMSFTDASKYEDVSKVSLNPYVTRAHPYAGYQLIIQTSASELANGIAPDGYTLLRAIRIWLELDMYVSFEVHTKTSIEQFKLLLVVFEERIIVGFT